MSTLPIEDYAVIGDTHTAALVGRNGSIDWMCVPKFDSGACFAALLGNEQNGRWSIAPRAKPKGVERRYRGETLVLETSYETDDGRVTLIDFMPIAESSDHADVMRIVRGDSGTVEMCMEATFRFDYGCVVPWLQQCEGGVRVVAGPDAMRLVSPVPLKNEDFRTHAEWLVREGESIAFHLAWTPSTEHGIGAPGDPEDWLKETVAWWQGWAERCVYEGQWREAVVRSLITLKALTYAPSGGIVAAATTSLPEQLGGQRNWDYRICWVRDATFLLYALLISGYTDEAAAWRDWLFRAVAGSPERLQIMYGLSGERRLPEFEVPWLSGYEHSQPVRIGNAAYKQLQLDVYGEILDAFYVNRKHDVPAHERTEDLIEVLLDCLESAWQKPDYGIWEVRGQPRHFTHSKAMAWVAADRAVKLVERYGFPGDVERWKSLRQRIHDDVCDNGFDRSSNAFTMYYGGDKLDAALLMLPMVGFLPADDPRMLGTIEAIRKRLTVGGLVRRYEHGFEVDGLPEGEGAFLPCTFWLADNLAMLGRTEEAEEIFERLLEVRNDVGLLAEEYDTQSRRLLGNFPQALSHVALVNTAFNLTRTRGPAKRRSEG